MSRFIGLFAVLLLTSSSFAQDLPTVKLPPPGEVVPLDEPVDLIAPELETGSSTRNSFQTESTFPKQRLTLKSEIPAPRDPEPVVPLVQERQSIIKHVYFESGNVVHRRLLFEEAALERTGASHPEPVQVIKSGAKFFVRGLLLPWAYPWKQFRAYERSSDFPRQ